MHKNHRVHSQLATRKSSAQHRFIVRAIIVVAATQPLATIPQVIAVYRTQDATSIAITTWLVYLVFDILWLWYGLAEKQKPIIISAVLFTLFEGLVLVGALLYGGTWW